MFFRPFRSLFAVLALVALTGCQNAPPPVQRLPPLSFGDLAPIQLNIGRIEVVEEYRSPLHAPNIEFEIPISPANAMKRWAQDRLHPMVREGTARLIIRNAPVIRTALQTDKELTGMFKDEQAERFDGTLEVAFQILDDRQFPVAEVVAQTSLTRSLAKSATLNDRERLWYDMVDHMVREIDGQLDRGIHNYMVRWLY